MSLHKWYENSSALSLPSRAHKTTFSRRKVLFIVCVPPFFLISLILLFTLCAYRMKLRKCFTILYSITPSYYLVKAKANLREIDQSNEIYVEHFISK